MDERECIVLMQAPLVRRALIARSCIAQHNCPHQRLPHSHTSSHRNAKNNKNVKKQNTTRLWHRQCAKIARLACWECWEQTSKNWGNPLANKALRPQKKILPPQRQYWQKCFNTFDYLQILASFKIDTSTNERKSYKEMYKFNFEKLPAAFSAVTPSSEGSDQM